MKNSTCLIFMLLLSYNMVAQDPIFYNNQQNRVYVNPAYAGTVESFSAGVNYRNQWPQLSGYYQTFTTEINQYLGKGNGVSVLYTHDNAAKTLFKNELNLGYGKTISFNDNHHLSMGVQVGFFEKNLNWQNLTFGDQIDPRRGFVYQSNDLPRGGPIYGLDINSGLLYYNKFFFFGTSVKHVTQPNESFFMSESRLPMLYSAQVGGKIILNEFTLLPSISAYQQGTFGPSVVGNLAARYQHFQLDVGYWSHNGPTVGLGVNYDHFAVGYFYGMRNNGTFSAFSHEVRAVFKAITFKKQNDHFFDF